MSSPLLSSPLYPGPAPLIPLPRCFTFAVGVEFAAELHDFVVDLQRLFPEQAEKVSITIVEGRGILGGFDASLREYAMKRFRRDRIVVRTGANVTHVDDGKARAVSGPNAGRADSLFHESRCTPGPSRRPHLKSVIPTRPGANADADA